MNFQHINNLNELIDELEVSPQEKPLLDDALEGVYSAGAARHLQRELLARYQAKEHIERAIQLLNSGKPEI